MADKKEGFRELVRHSLNAEQVEALIHQLTGRRCLTVEGKRYSFSIYDSDGSPIEIEERAAFEKEFAAKGRPLTRADYDPDAYGNAFDDGAWAGWQARAGKQ